MISVRLASRVVLPAIVFVSLAIAFLPKASGQTLVHRWSFENDYLDTSGSGNNGTTTGAPTFVSGKFGQAVSLTSGADGVHVDVGALNLPLLGADVWSMNVWVNLTTPLTTLEHIAGFSLDDGYLGAADNGRARSFTSQTGPNNNNFYFWGANADRASNVGYDADSQWHMYTISYNGTNINMYKDAVLVTSAPPTPNGFLQAYDQVHVGNPSQWPPDAFTGGVDEFTIFNGALSESQVGGLYFNNDISQPVLLNPSFTVNRDTGEVVLTNDSSFAIEILGYTIKSASGSLKPMDWDTIAGRFDAAGDHSIDINDNWTVLTNTNQAFSVELSEGVPGTDGGTIPLGKVINFGSSWAENPVEDISIDLLLDDGLGTIKTLTAAFSGNSGNHFVVGDFDADGDVDTADWQYFRTRPIASLLGTTQTQGYFGGDLDGDHDKDIFDFDRFVKAYNAANGSGAAFQAMLASVPEPSGICLFCLFGLAALIIRRRNDRSLLVVIAAAVIFGAGTTTNRAHAAVNAYYKLNGNANENTGVNINLNLQGDAGFIGSVHPGLGTALSLDGNGDGAIGASYNKIQTSDYTLMAWVYATSLEGTWETIVKQWGDVRGQFHFGVGRTGTPAGTSDFIDDEYGRTPTASTVLSSTAPAFPTNQWVHVAATLDSVNGFHRIYINGDVVAQAAYPGPGALGNKTNGAANQANGLGIGMKPNTAGTVPSVGAPGYWNGYIDDVGIYDNAFSEAQIEQVIANSQVGIQLDGTTVPYVRLQVDRSTGDIKLLNQTAGAVGINAYQISSPSGRLQPNDWDALGGNSGFPVGGGTGNGWEKDAASNSTQLLETYFSNSSSFGNGLEIPLGDIFAGGTEDLVFQYRTTDGSVVKSLVDYVGTAPGLTGDYNGNGIVDAADYVVWRKNLGLMGGATPGRGDGNGDGNVTQADYTVWRSHFGNGGPGSGVSAGAAVPEPGSLAIILSAALMFLFRRPRSR